MTYRFAIIGIGVGVSCLIGFAHYLGMTWWIGVIFFLIYFALALAITRMRAELGTPIHDLHFTGPELIMTRVGGQRGIRRGEPHGVRDVLLVQPRLPLAPHAESVGILQVRGAKPNRLPPLERGLNGPEHGRGLRGVLDNPAFDVQLRRRIEIAPDVRRGTLQPTEYLAENSGAGQNAGISRYLGWVHTGVRPAMAADALPVVAPAPAGIRGIVFMGNQSRVDAAFSSRGCANRCCFGTAGAADFSGPCRSSSA